MKEGGQEARWRKKNPEEGSRGTPYIAISTFREDLFFTVVFCYLGPSNLLAAPGWAWAMRLERMGHREWTNIQS